MQQMGPTGLGGEGSLLLYPDLVFFLGNFSTIVQQEKKLHNHAQASRSAQLNDHLVQTPT